VRTRSRVSPRSQTHVLQICPGGDGDPPSHSLSPLPPGLPINSPPPRTRDTARPRRASIRHSPGPCCRRRLLQLLAARRTGSSSQHPRSQPAACAWTPDRSSRRRLPGRPMGRAPCCEKEGLRRGAWSAEEDQRLVAYVRQNGHPNWRALPRLAGLLRCGKSCRLRWINYLRPDIKRGNFTPDEEALIVRLHRELGNRSVRQHSAAAVIPFRLLLLLAQIFRPLF
jgi:hypothetical protein